ncbi:MAG: Fe-S cluster assembly ATPase SufC [Candidatus Micrarchaeota archaeon]|nr:Fe-S cluster assembly ATPase SufC [Candidatus Micrarchaeota archaeon]
MALLSLKNLRVSAGEKEIIQGVSLEVGEGEVHVIMGQNGSGKSTLLSSLAGNPKYSVSGKAVFEGKDLLALKPHERARRGLFLAFQSPIEVPGVSLASFLRRAYAARFGDEMSALEFDKILSAKAEAAGVARSFLQRGINDGMSGGERKMSEILQLSVLEPRLAMLDEPDSGLDVDALERVGAAIGKIRKNGMSMIIVTHYARVLRSIKADRVHVLHAGKLAASGDERLAHKIEEKGYGWVLQ